jgi:hypothetical protein
MSCGNNRAEIEVLMNPDSLHCGATGEAETPMTTPIAFYCIGCKLLACCFAGLVVHFSL